MSSAHPKRQRTSTRQPRLRLTIQILYKIWAYLLTMIIPSYSNIMLWAMCRLAFLAFSGSANSPYIPGQNLYGPTLLQDVLIDSRDTPRMLRVTIKQSKTNPFKKGVQLYIGAMDRRIYPVNAMLAHLGVRKGQAWPLFITKQGRGFTRQMFSSALDALLTHLKLDCRIYNTHSFRIRTATSAVRVRIPHCQIKILG